MDANRFEIDELTGLTKWPVLLTGDWSHWTDEPCAVLYAETHGWENNDELQRKVSELLRSPNWPHLAPFYIGSGGFLVLAPAYSPAQALLLAQSINRELEAAPSSHPSWSTPPSAAATLTWGMTCATESNWDLPRTLQAAIAPVQHAIREKRFGSINETLNGSASRDGDIFWVCSRHDQLTELKVWGCTAALCSNYADESVALLLGDVDNMKTCLDHYGIPAGDILLQMIAHVLRRFESNDVATFRFGGDEFGVWVRGHSLERARQLAEHINAQIRVLEIPVPYLESPLGNFSVSWGVVATSAREANMPALITKAKELIDQAKSEQRGSIKAERL